MIKFEILTPLQSTKYLDICTRCVVYIELFEYHFNLKIALLK